MMGSGAKASDQAVRGGEAHQAPGKEERLERRSRQDPLGYQKC